jgi:hypothetical protein
MSMSVFKHIPMGEEGLEEVYRWLDDHVAEHKEIAHKKSIGTSQEHRDIPAVFVTNREIPDNVKQIAVVTLARHGQELGTRVVGPEILNYLVSDEAKEVRDTQVVIVVPVVNPDGFVRNEFHSSMTSLTKTERLVLGELFKAYPPDMIIDFHSLGKEQGSKYDCGDMEVIIPANTTRWGMDEQIHQYVAQKMREAAEAAGWPYEIHTLEDLAAYYFGGTKIGNMPWTYLQEKVYLLHTQDFYDDYHIPEERGYTNYTCGPAYLAWHSLVFGMETNHHALSAEDIATSGMVPCRALLEMGSTRFPWEKDRGYPVNILQGDFRISIRPVGRNSADRRASRTRIWKERTHFSMPQREMPDQQTTVARARYFGDGLPMQFALCLRMRRSPISSVTLAGRQLDFETFPDNCSTFLYIPVVMEHAGTVELIIKHPGV